MSDLNPNCDGEHCTSETAETRLYSLGEHGNLILCPACWKHENDFRAERAAETGNPQAWPQKRWHDAAIYS